MSEHITLEEAAEIVLNGPVYETCTHCEGGFVGPVHKMGTSSFNSSPIYTRGTCPICQGHGRHLQPLYAFACGMVGKLIPEVPAAPQWIEASKRQREWAIQWYSAQKAREGRCDASKSDS